MAGEHTNDDGMKMPCSATSPDKCRFSKNGEHLAPNASPEEVQRFEEQCERVAQQAAGKSAAAPSGVSKKSKKAKSDPLEDDGRMWIGENGQLVCSKHGGNYLREKIEASPKGPHHSTPLGTWVDVTNNPDVEGIPCEICEEG